MSNPSEKGKKSLLAWAVALIALGLIWLGQGLGFIGGSFMTGQPLWAIAGGASLAVGIVLIVTDRRRR